MINDPPGRWSPGWSPLACLLWPARTVEPPFLHTSHSILIRTWTSSGGSGQPELCAQLGPSVFELLPELVLHHFACDIYRQGLYDLHEPWDLVIRQASLQELPQFLESKLLFGGQSDNGHHHFSPGWVGHA